MYQFPFPISLLGQGVLPSITRVTQAVGLKPRFILEPQAIEFKRKIITTLDKRVPGLSSINLCNPDLRVLKWCIDTKKLDDDQIFSLLPNSGSLQPGEQVEIKAVFNPYKDGTFEQCAELYIDDNLDKSQISIRLKGEGLFPRITFDRREIILPIVPLNVTSKCVRFPF